MELFASRDAGRRAAAEDAGASAGAGAGRVQYFSMHPGWSETEGLDNALPGLTSSLRCAPPPPAALSLAVLTFAAAGAMA